MQAKLVESDEKVEELTEQIKTLKMQKVSWELYTCCGVLCRRQGSLPSSVWVLLKLADARCTGGDWQPHSSPRQDSMVSAPCLNPDAGCAGIAGAAQRPAGEDGGHASGAGLQQRGIRRAGGPRGLVRCSVPV